MSQPLHILLVGRIYEEQEVFETIQRVIILFGHSHPVHFYFLDERTLDKVTAKSFKTIHDITYSLFEKDNAKQHAIDYVITIGGDGTILYTAKQFPQKAPPIISFQRGTLGFMCRFELEQIQEVVDELTNYYNLKAHNSTLEFPFTSTEIMRIKAEQYRYSPEGELVERIGRTCINEVCITRQEAERIILEIFINKEKITETAGDGILISTPTGSTAYSLSAGGPIMQNGINSILITPIAPNSLSFRPICLPSDSEITIRLSPKSRSSGFVSYDGQTNLQFHKGDEVCITKSQYGIKCNILQPNEKMSKMPTWMQRLKFFLGWNETFKYPQCKTRMFKGINRNSIEKQAENTKWRLSNKALSNELIIDQANSRKG